MEPGNIATATRQQAVALTAMSRTPARGRAASVIRARRPAEGEAARSSIKENAPENPVKRSGRGLLASR
jgi:hypothetical protein